ncbi:hypothetical protein [Frigidibacter mobilis]|uniref:Uncharacterized protein n=1 Tax=Frigidibacter mobilis TaxID=1335048 RepID=A0A159ZBD0_9RHOB|nr:hypothetical protein [Frigidibacter mobilis]AMY72164.1 hypothetical protein AKL17_3p0008 [Frigidibacter mobilis]
MTMIVDFHAELMGWIPPPDGIAMCQGVTCHGIFDLIPANWTV